MTGLQIKVEGEWLALPEDFSISLEDQSPVFNDQGAFSFPFEIPIAPNRAVLRNIADAFGAITLADIDKMKAEMWFDGVLVYRGLLETDDSVEIDDSISVTFISGNSDFESSIDDLQLRDLPLDRDIYLGNVLTELNAKVQAYVGQGGGRPIYIRGAIDIPLPQYATMGFTECNVSKPYPQAVFCNVRICCSNGEGGYKVLGAYRSKSGVCFYVMYALDLLFRHIGIAVGRNDLYTVEDMTRLAFFTTACDYELRNKRKATVNDGGPFVREDSCPIAMNSYWKTTGVFHLGVSYNRGQIDKTYDVNVGSPDCEIDYTAEDAYATNQNFPDISVSDLIDDLKNAFGIRFVYDNRANKVDILFIKDILSDNEVRIMDVEILDYTVKRTKFKGNTFTYGEEDDTMYNYSDFSNVVPYSGYKPILNKGVTKTDTTCKYDTLTGNFYRVKVNKDTGGDPSLFEVGGYNSWGIGGTSDDEREEISLSFTPVVVNDVQKTMYGVSEITENQCLAVYVDADLSASYISQTTFNYTEESGDIFITPEIVFEVPCPGAFDSDSGDDSPLESYDGYVLGIMRGPGSDSHLVYTTDYDGEGNDQWVQTSGNYAFTADSCDNFGNFFDYNGTEEGGVDQSGRISLKIVATKEGYGADSKYADRGLASKFMGEYMYFLSKKKVVTLSVDMSLMQIVNIDYTKRYRIGNFVGWINKVTYELHLDGISDVKIELYTI